MITADNLTDAMIDQFIADELAKPHAQRDCIAHRLAFVALGKIIPSKGKTRRGARERLAEILNARKEQS